MEPSICSGSERDEGEGTLKSRYLGFNLLHILGILLLSFGATASVGCRTPTDVRELENAAEKRIDRQDETDAFTTVRGTFFEMLVPSSVKVERRQMADFERFTFYHEPEGANGFLTAYDASFPPFPCIAPESVDVKRTKINGLSAKSIRWEEASGLRSREVLITLWESKKHPPAMLHLMYFDLARAEADMADEAIDTVTYVPGVIELMYEE